jgi:hypothetical protein
MIRGQAHNSVRTAHGILTPPCHHVKRAAFQRRVNDPKNKEETKPDVIPNPGLRGEEPASVRISK